MSKHDLDVTLRQMLGNAQEALQLSQSRTREQLAEDRLYNLAITPLLEVMGEAATCVPPDFRSRHAEIALGEVIGLRNRLIHGYDSIDLDIVWQVITVDLPKLVDDLAKLI